MANLSPHNHPIPNPTKSALYQTMPPNKKMFSPQPHKRPALRHLGHSLRAKLGRILRRSFLLLFIMPPRAVSAAPVCDLVVVWTSPHHLLQVQMAPQRSPRSQLHHQKICQCALWSPKVSRTATTTTLDLVDNPHNMVCTHNNS